MTETPHTPKPHKKLRRSGTDIKVAGVCGGWASYLGVDTAVLRILFIALMIFSCGAGIIFYLASWMLMPAANQAE